jgi:hypothetical protein
MRKNARNHIHKGQYGRICALVRIFEVGKSNRNCSNGRDKAIFAEFPGIWEISKAHRRRLRELLAQASIDLYRVRK